MMIVEFHIKIPIMNVCPMFSFQIMCFNNMRTICHYMYSVAFHIPTLHYTNKT